MAATTCRRLEGFCTGRLIGGLHNGLRVALALGMLVGGASVAGNALRIPVATAQSACTTTPCCMAYGPDPFPFGDLWVPSGLSPPPVAVRIPGTADAIIPLVVGQHYRQVARGR